MDPLSRTPMRQNEAEYLDIIELEDRLDMTADPLAFVLSPNTNPTNTHCHNFFCCL